MSTITCVKPDVEYVDVLAGDMRRQINVLDQGHVALVDVMPRLVPAGRTADFAICQAARVSYGSGTKQVRDDEQLIRYLVRHRHTSPLEMVQLKFHMKMPIFAARQLIRHRTACLAGDVILSFDHPGGKTHNSKLNRHYPLTVADVFRRFQPSVNKSPAHQKNPHFKRDRVQGMLLRSLNEESREIYHTKIVDIWQNGIKPITKVVFDNGSTLRATKDHLCLTDKGWLRLEDAIATNARFAGVDKSPPPIRQCPPLTGAEIDQEIWLPVPGFEGRYEVSDLGRVRSWASARGDRASSPTIKCMCARKDGHMVVSLSRGGKSPTFFVHALVLAAFCGDPTAGHGQETRHLDGCPSNNRLSNLLRGSSQANHDDRMVQGGDQRLGTTWRAVRECLPDGEEMTYDIEVAGPFHNFCAGGVFVHNSVNEYSGRYSEVPEAFWMPDQWRGQDDKNKQGSEGVIAYQPGEYAARHEEEAWDSIEQRCFTEYRRRLESGVSREMARSCLPLSTYTEWYWLMDLHNLLHFLRLRMDEHAQAETREYALAIFALIETICPVTCRAFMDFHFNSVTLTRLEVDALKASIIRGEPCPLEGPHVSAGEQKEWNQKALTLHLEHQGKGP